MQTNLEHQIEHLKSDKEVLKERIDGMSIENRVLARAIGRSKDTIKELTGQNELLKTETKNQGNEIKKLHEQINALKDENKVFKARLADTRTKFGSTDNNTPKKSITRQRETNTPKKSITRQRDNNTPKRPIPRQRKTVRAVRPIILSDEE